MEAGALEVDLPLGAGAEQAAIIGIRRNNGRNTMFIKIVLAEVAVADLWDDVDTRGQREHGLQIVLEIIMC